MNRTALFLLSFLVTGCTGSNEMHIDSGSLKSVTFGEDTTADTIVMSPMNEGETVMLRFLVKNRTGKDLQIERINSGCGCTSATWDRNPLSDGRETEVMLLYNSSGQFGTQFKTIEVWTDDGNNKTIYLAGEVKY